VSIRKGAMLGAQGVATHDVAEGTIAGGVPARKIMSATEAHRLGEHNGDGPCEELPPNE